MVLFLVAIVALGVTMTLSWSVCLSQTMHCYAVLLLHNHQITQKKPTNTTLPKLPQPPYYQNYCNHQTTKSTSTTKTTKPPKPPNYQNHQSNHNYHQTTKTTTTILYVVCRVKRYCYLLKQIYKTSERP